MVIIVKHKSSPNFIQPALQVYQLTVNYDKTPVLWDVSLSVPSGNIVGVIGPNGAGKTTFVKTVLNLIKPISGKVEFFGLPLKGMNHRVAYIPQKETVDWDFPITVLDLVLMGRYGRLGLFRRPRKADVEAAKHYLEVLGMSSFVERQISQLSGGQQQRVFIARALLQEADIYFMDEPFVGVDITTERVIVDLLHKLKADGKTIFIVHHDLGTVTSYFNWVIMLNMHLVACGAVDEVFNEETLQRAFKRSHTFLGEVAKLSQNKTSGIL